MTTDYGTYGYKVNQTKNTNCLLLCFKYKSRIVEMFAGYVRPEVSTPLGAVCAVRTQELRLLAAFIALVGDQVFSVLVGALTLLAPVSLIPI